MFHLRVPWGIYSCSPAGAGGSCSVSGLALLLLPLLDPDFCPGKVGACGPPGGHLAVTRGLCRDL